MPQGPRPRPPRRALNCEAPRETVWDALLDDHVFMRIPTADDDVFDEDDAVFGFSYPLGLWRMTASDFDACGAVDSDADFTGLCRALGAAFAEVGRVEVLLHPHHVALERLIEHQPNFVE